MLVNPTENLPATSQQTDIKGKVSVSPIDYSSLGIPEEFKGFEALFNYYLRDIAGLEGGFKQGAIIYVKKVELHRTIGLFSRLGYETRISDFTYDKPSGGVQRTQTNLSEQDYFTLYISRSLSVAMEIEALDKRLVSGQKPSFDNTKRVGELLGYPECCIEFVGRNDAIGRLQHLAQNDLDNHSLYRFLGLQASSRVSYLLNNFNARAPRLVGFFVCNYDCTAAKRYALGVIEYIRKEKLNLEMIERQLRRPILFFSYREYVTFDRAWHVGPRVHYENPVLSNLTTPLLEQFLRADSFEVTPDAVKIFDRNQLIQNWSKPRVFNGVFVEFQ
jgi:hypothetical protein